MALLPKISNALAKFVTPVAQSSAQTKTGMQPHQAPQPKAQAPKETPKKPDLKLVPPISREPDESDDAQDRDPDPQAKQEGFQRFAPKTAQETSAELPAAPLDASDKSVASKLLDIFRVFQDGKQNLSKWAGNRVYKDMTKDEQKGKFRRGAMLDEKIE